MGEEKKQKVVNQEVIQPDVVVNMNLTEESKHIQDELLKVQNLIQNYTQALSQLRTQEVALLGQLDFLKKKSQVAIVIPDKKVE